MKKTILHLRRSFGKTFLFFLLLFCVAVFLQTTQFLQKTEKEMMVGIQTILQPRLRIRTPFAYGQFDEEQKIDAERELFLSTLATLKDDPRVTDVCYEPILNNGFLFTFTGIDDDDSLVGVVTNPVALLTRDEEGKIVERSREPKGIFTDGDWRFVRKTQDPYLRYLDCLRLAFHHRDSAILYAENPEQFVEVPTKYPVKPIVPTLVGVNQLRISDFLGEHADIVKGRLFSEQEREQGAAVIVAPWNTFLFQEGAWRPLDIGDRIPLSIIREGIVRKTEWFTVIGFHNGGEDRQINGEFTYHRMLGNYFYLPQKRWTAIQQAVDRIMKKEQWQEMSHIQVDGQYVENVDSDRDHISMTVPYVFVRDFDDLADITKQISLALTQLNTIHGEEEYVIESTYDDYQQLFGTLHSSKRMITSVAWFGLFLSMVAIPLLLFFVLLQRQSEFAIRRTLGESKPRLYATSFIEYYGIGAIAFGVATLVAQMATRAWKSHLFAGVEQEWAKKTVAISEDAIEKIRNVFLTSTTKKENVLLFLLWTFLFVIGCLIPFLWQKKKERVSLFSEE